VTIDEYLAELKRCLRARPIARRRILREVEAHLHDAAAQRGEQAAVDSFGPPDVLARRFSRPAHASLRRLGASTAGAFAVAVAGVAILVTSQLAAYAGYRTVMCSPTETGITPLIALGRGYAPTSTGGGRSFTLASPTSADRFAMRVGRAPDLCGRVDSSPNGINSSPTEQDYADVEVTESVDS